MQGDVVQLAPVGDREAEPGDRIAELRFAGQAAGFDADRSAGGTCTRCKSAALSRRTWKADLVADTDSATSRAACMKPALDDL